MAPCQLQLNSVVITSVDIQKTRCVKLVTNAVSLTRAQWASSEAENSAIVAAVKRLGLIKREAQTCVRISKKCAERFMFLLPPF